MQSVKKRIVLITTTQPAANPRLVKEADALSAAGHDVTVLYSFVAAWAQEEDKKILKNSKWRYKQIGGKGVNAPAYRMTRVTFAFYKLLNRKTGGRLYIEESMARCFKPVVAAAKKLKADWYIGHNPGAMAIASLAAKEVNGRSGFDFEDYHRGEYTNTKSLEVRRQALAEKKYLKSFDYISIAAPLFGDNIRNDNPQITVSFLSLLNCFPLTAQPAFREGINKKLELLWFSQHIGKDRGLEIIIRALKALNDDSVRLTLVGNCPKETKEYFFELAGEAAGSIHFPGIVSPEDLPGYAARFDVGLALELQSPLNRDLCLSNKIFTYLLAGNAIIFTETSAQDQFNRLYGAGNSFLPGDMAGLQNCIALYRDASVLLAQRKKNYALAKEKLNWEKESQKLLALIV